MAILIAAPLPGQSLHVKSLSRGPHSIKESGFGSSRSSQSVKEVSSRFAGLGSDFVGESLPVVNRLQCRVGSRGAISISVQHCGNSAECWVGRSERGSNCRRVFPLTFRRGADWRRQYGGSGTFFGPEMKRVSGQTQKERFREIIENEIRARQRNKSRFAGGRAESDDYSNYDSSLIRELEKRLREEEDSVKESADSQDESTIDRAEGPKTASELTTVELMKELEKRLQAEREKHGKKRQDEERSRESPRFRRRVSAENVTSWYDDTRDSYRGVHDERVRLEELWIQLGRQLGSHRRGARERTHEGRRRERSASPETVNNQKETSQKLDESEVVSAPDAPQHPQSDGNVVYLKNEANGAEIYLVGTSHVSEKSADLVREVIQRVKPDFVMVELCQKRYEAMTRNLEMDRGGVMSFVERMLRFLIHGKEGVGAGLARFFKILFRGFHPGKELLVAIEEGTTLGAKIVLGDQDIDTTQKQLGQSLNIPIRGFHNHFGDEQIWADLHDTVKKQGFTDMYEAMQDRKVVRRFNEEVKKGAPSIYKVLLTDRNQIMIKALRNLKGKVVAVVGLAHMDGMEQLWHQANEKDIANQSTQSEE